MSGQACMALIFLLLMMADATEVSSAPPTRIFYHDGGIAESKFCEYFDKALTTAHDYDNFLVVSQHRTPVKCSAVSSSPALVVQVYLKDVESNNYLVVADRGGRSVGSLTVDVPLTGAIDQSLRMIESNKVQRPEDHGVFVATWLLILCAIVVVLVIGLMLYFCVIPRKSKKNDCVESGLKSKSSSSKRKSFSKKGSSKSSKSKSKKGDKKCAFRSSTMDSSAGSSSSKKDRSTGSSRQKKEAKLTKKKSEAELVVEGKAREIIDAAISKSVVLPAPRSASDRLENPVSPEEFVAYMRQVVEFSVSYLTDSKKYRVQNESKPGTLFEKIPERPPETPEEFAAIMHDFKTSVMDTMLHWKHPRFYGFFPVGQSFPDIIAETLIATFGIPGFSWAVCPALTEMEFAMVNWLGRAYGIPESFLYPTKWNPKSTGGGHLVDTASDASFTSLIASRHKKLEECVAKWRKDQASLPPEKRENKDDLTLKGEIMTKLVAYGSREAHTCFEKACSLATVHCRTIATKEQNDYAMTKDEIEREIVKDMERGYIPFHIHVTLGTTGSSTFDNLSEIVTLREKYGVWVNVDAAYGGNFWVVPDCRSNQKGIEHVDSLNVNLHKNCMTSPSCGVVWTRHQELYKKPFVLNASFLARAKDTSDLRDWGVQLTRRFKALKVWFLFRMYGTKGMRRHCEKQLEGAKQMEAELVKLPNIRRIGKINLGLFCIRYHEEGKDDAYLGLCTRALCKYLNDSNEIYFTYTTVGPRDAIRVSPNCQSFDQKLISDSVGIFTKLLNEFIEKKNKDPSFLDDVGLNPTKFRLLRPQLCEDRIVGSPAITLVPTPNDAVTDASLVDRSQISVIQTEKLPVRKVAMPPIEPAFPSKAPEKLKDDSGSSSSKADSVAQPPSAAAVPAAAVPAPVNPTAASTTTAMSSAK